MNYTRNNIFDTIYGKLIAEYPTAYISSKFEPVPASFPAILIRELGRYALQQNVSMSGAQGVFSTTYEVQISTNKVNSPAQQAWEIADEVITAFASIRFILASSNIIDDSEIYRLKLTFRKVIGVADEIPT